MQSCQQQLLEAPSSVLAMSTLESLPRGPEGALTELHDARKIVSTSFD